MGAWRHEQAMSVGESKDNGQVIFLKWQNIASLPSSNTF